MKKLSNNYHKMKLWVVILIFLIFVPLAFAEKVAEIDLTIFKDNTVLLQKLRTYEGQVVETPIQESLYILKIVDKENIVIDAVPLPVLFLILSEPPQEVDAVPLNVRLKYNINWKTLRIYHKGSLIFEKDIENYFCNNNDICDVNENYISCPRDCPSGSKDGWCDRRQDGRCDPDCSPKEDIDCKKPFPWTMVIVSLVAFLIVVVVFGYFLLARHQREQVLIRYIEAAKGGDIPEEKIKQKLMESGWPEKKIDKHLKS